MTSTSTRRVAIVAVVRGLSISKRDQATPETDEALETAS